VECVRLASFICALAWLGAVAQQNNVLLQRDIYLDVERAANTTERIVHTGLKPLIESRANLNGVLAYTKDTAKYYYGISRKLFAENIVELETPDLTITADPLVHFELGQDLSDTSTFSDTTRLYVNTRGFVVRGNLSGKVSFTTMFAENQAIYPLYLYRYTQRYQVVPGQGRIKEFEQREFDYAWAQGNVSWTPWRWLNLQLGNGKHFVGHGYRSLLLSDNSFSYPYAKMSLWLAKDRVQYSTIWAKLHLLQRLPDGEGAEDLFYWKRATFQHVGFHFGRVQLALFESTMWRTIDAGGVRPYNPLQLLPLFGVSTLLNGFNGEHNSMLGASARLSCSRSVVVYGQFAMDDAAAGKQAWQAGLHWYDAGVRGLHLQAEYDLAEAFTYANTPSETGYTHYGQPMAHPMGAFFSEFVGLADLRRGRWWMQTKVDLARTHPDASDSTNFGSDVLRGDRPSILPEGTDRQLTYVDVSVGYMINPMQNFRFSLGYAYRDRPQDPFAPERTSYLYLALRTHLWDRYHDL
jgi:hypothetical protein